jgi:hypothetical protein
MKSNHMFTNKFEGHPEYVLGDMFPTALRDVTGALTIKYREVLMVIKEDNNHFYKLKL